MSNIRGLLLYRQSNFDQIFFSVSLADGTRRIMSDRPAGMCTVRTLTLIAVTQMKFARTCIALAAIIAPGSFSG
jgi:hypothetical protein